MSRECRPWPGCSVRALIVSIATLIALGVTAIGASANDASLKKTLRDAQRSGSTFMSSPALGRYSPLIGQSLARLQLKAVNQSLAGNYPVWWPSPGVLSLVREGVGRASAVEHLAESFRPRFVIARTSLRADQPSSSQGRIAKALGVEASTTMIKALDALIGSAEAKADFLLKMAQGCFLATPIRCGSAQQVTLFTAFSRESQSALDELAGALKRLG
jgi:hypothetical protein